jgi:hypothetical protein
MLLLPLLSSLRSHPRLLYNFGSHGQEDSIQPAFFPQLRSGASQIDLLAASDSIWCAYLALRLMRSHAGSRVPEQEAVSKRWAGGGDHEYRILNMEWLLGELRQFLRVVVTYKGFLSPSFKILVDLSSLQRIS